MRTVWRYTIRAITVLSLLLCLTTAWLWWKSYQLPWYRFVASLPWHGIGFAAESGQLVANWRINQHGTIAVGGISTVMPDSIFSITDD